MATACKECHKQENRDYRARHDNRVYNKELDAKNAIKTEVFSHYSGGEAICIRCGFSDLRALSIDHINGKGCEHRKELKRTGVSFYRWLRDNLYPEGFQVLCMNCQFIKRHDNQEHNGRPKKVRP